MGWTKRQLVEEAFGELALAGYDFDLQPEEMQAGLRRLDSMMATWLNLGLPLGYAISASQDDSDLDQDSGLQAIANEAVYMGLACRIAASKGKALPASTKINAKQAYDALVLNIAKSQVQEQQLPSGTPQGQGRKPWRTVNPYFLPPDTSPLRSGGDGLNLTGLGN